ncbi:MAG: hypothetical protein J0626_02045, partial [Rhodospirillaceae bacterium]|nr:hypothetical protein [Rhodospirillaceae bacterium]
MTRRISRGIGSKLLLVVLPCMLLGAVSMFMLFEQYTLRGRLSALQTRLDSFAVTQAASLVKPLWEFDGTTVERQFRSYADVPELLSAKVVNADGNVIASVDGHYLDGYL